MNETDVKTKYKYKNEFHFSEDHRNMNAMDPVQS